MLELLKSGEPFLFANLFVALVTLALIVQRIRTLWLELGSSASAVQEQVIGFVEAGSFARALEACGGRAHPLKEIMKAALSRANRSEREIRRAVEVAAIAALPKIKRGTAYMPQLSNVATLFGLIGTIRGLIISFSGVSGGDASARTAMLSQGISIAFYNTFFGLAIAVAIILAYMVILGRQNRLLAEMELGSAKLIDALLLHQSLGREREDKRGSA